LPAPASASVAPTIAAQTRAAISLLSTVLHA
jgi:hypothetical protein